MMESVGYTQQGDGVDFEFKKTKSEHNDNNFDSQKVEYSIYGILNFLQSEWTKMSIERSRWEFERAELQVLFLFHDPIILKTKIFVLQNEKLGCENLKSDLVRRIKMLEYALQQERFKNFSLKYPKESKSGEVSKDNQENSAKPEGLNTVERARLREYLRRVGMDKLSSEMRAAKVKELLEIPLKNDVSGKLASL